MIIVHPWHHQHHHLRRRGGGEPTSAKPACPPDWSDGKVVGAPEDIHLWRRIV